MIYFNVRKTNKGSMRLLNVIDMVKGTIDDVDISKGKTQVDITIQNFGRETKHVYKLNDVDGAKWFLNSIANDRGIRLKIKDPDLVETAIKTIAKAHMGKAGYRETGWEYNPDNLHALKDPKNKDKPSQLDKVKENDRKLIYRAAIHFKSNDNVVAAAKLAKVSLTKTYTEAFRGKLNSHGKKLEKAAGF
jgi:hypothetical protein